VKSCLLPGGFFGNEKWIFFLFMNVLFESRWILGKKGPFLENMP